TLDSNASAAVSGAGNNLTFDAGAGSTITLGGVAAGNGFTAGAQTSTGSITTAVALTQINIVGAAGTETFTFNTLGNPLPGLDVDASVETTVLNADITTQDIATNAVVINSGAVQLANSVNITTDNVVNDGAITFAGTVDNGFSLVLNKGTATATFGGTVGGGTALSSLTVDALGTTALTGRTLPTTAAA